MEPLRLEVTESAERALAGREAPLPVQLELLFSCLVRKRVLFQQAGNVVSYPMESADERLVIRFRPVMTRVCLVSEQSVPDLEDFPIHNARAFMPRWLALDFRDGAWAGDFGWQR